jgi:alpha,alpha-trehalase
MVVLRSCPGPWSWSLVVASSLLTCTPRHSQHSPASVSGVEPRVNAAPAPVSLTRPEAETALCRLFSDLDRDCDARLTIEDGVLPGYAQAGTNIEYSARLGKAQVSLADIRQASQLAQELALGLSKEVASSIELDVSRVNLDPGSYLASRIRHQFWDDLTRRIDPSPHRLLRATTDPKLGALPMAAPRWCDAARTRCGALPRQGEAARPRSAAPGQVGTAVPSAPPKRFVYVPQSDARAVRLFSNAGLPDGLEVSILPQPVTPQWVRSVTAQRRHGLLTLALDDEGQGRPFVVPGGRFNEMYGWDSFFIVWGLVQQPERVQLARAIVDNQIYEITHYGKVLNANRSYYLTRSQPPFISSMISLVWEASPRGVEQRAWLRRALLAAIAEYEAVWSVDPRRTGTCADGVCLARYFDEGTGEPPEVEPGHFAWFYQSHARASGRCVTPGSDIASRREFVRCAQQLGADYRAGVLNDPQIDAFFLNDRCVRESGHDTTYRWFSEGTERCAEFATVDLNSLLFKLEIDIARLLNTEFDGELQGHLATQWCARAKARALLMQRFMWDERAGAFFDYDVGRSRRSEYLSATTLYPLWASAPNPCATTLVTREQAQRTRDAALAALEARGGLMATDPSARQRTRLPEVLVLDAAGDVRRDGQAAARQWEAPNGWSPHQMLAWAGLRSFGFDADAQRLAYRWLHTIVRNAADYHGMVPEKFDVVKASHKVFAEYGNVNTEFSYIAQEGFGWMNASYVVGSAFLSPELRAALQQLTPIDALF